ncbi:MAG: hypothetical protein EP324_00825 [Gammaproteobacteria bacterium]|nr:MAG: hypothetical protein EP324_00825 [Gammaproteobacteria bacterium]
MNIYEYSNKALAKKLGRAVKQERINTGLKREDLISRADITDYHLRKVESGNAFLALLPVLRELGLLDQLVPLLEMEDLIDPKLAFENKPTRQRVRS